MERVLRLELHDFDITPPTLLSGASPRREISVNLASLYHHYYLDKHGIEPPDPDPSKFEYLRFIAPTPDLRFTRSGIGANRAAKQHASNELGQAFCRWFLGEHLDITYFAHMEDVLRGNLRADFDSFTVTRKDVGDTPDYFCAIDASRVCLAEAKGRYSPIGFRTKEFGQWRKQFDRVEVELNGATLRSLKGFVVATRFATEESSQRIHTTLYAEDPKTPGEGSFDGREFSELGTKIINTHYSRVAQKLAQPLLGSALLNGVPLPDEVLVLVTVWEFLLGPLQGQRFVGGYYPSPTGQLPIELSPNGQIATRRPDPFRLDVGMGTFFGIEEKIFRQIVTLARTRTMSATNLPRFEAIAPFYSAISLHRDGTVLAPLEFFRPVQQIQL